jgi:hypothetical protein
LLVVVQFPIADLRPFLPDPAKRFRPPDLAWPPKVKIPRQFVHAFGPAVTRHRGADWAWLDEQAYCRADRALRFVRLPVEKAGWKGNVRCAFRRLLTDGKAVTRVEIGLSWIPQDEETFLWKSWDKAVNKEEDPTERLTDRSLDVNPLDIVGHVAAIPTTIHPMLPGKAGENIERPFILQGRRLAELYWKATASNKATGSPNGIVADGPPIVLIECRSYWIDRLPKNFIRVNPASAAYVNLAFGRMKTAWGPLGVWILGHERAYAEECRSLRLCLLRLHGEQEVLDIVLNGLSSGAIQYRSSDSLAERIEEYLNSATERIFRRSWGHVEQSAILQAQDAANATEYRAVRAELAERLEGARRQVVQKLEVFERRNYVRAVRIINVEPGSTYVEEVKQMTDQSKTINIGPGANVIAPLVIADHIENSFNAVAKSDLKPDLKDLINDLLKQVATASKDMPPDKAKQMARDAEALVGEVSGPAPRKEWYELSIKGLQNAAKAVGEVGKPILETTAKLLPLIVSLFP